MIKIQFLLKRPNEKQESLEYITIAEPKIDKSQKFTWGYRYVCETYYSDINKYNSPPIWGINPIDILCLASENAKIHLQRLIKDGYTISEVETKEPWKLEKLSDTFIKDRINEVKNNPNISQEDKEKILEGMNKVII